MDFVSESNIASLIKAYNINFIGMAITPFHAHGINCCLIYLRSHGIKTHALIIIEATNHGEYIIDSTNFSGQDIKYIYKFRHENEKAYIRITNEVKTFFYTIIDTYNKNEQSIYLASPWYPNTHIGEMIHSSIKNIKINYFIVDEGLSTYFKRINSINRVIKNYFNETHIKIAKHAIYYISNNIKYNIIKSSPGYINFNLFIKDNNKKYRINHLAIDYYKKAIETYKKQLPTTNKEYHFNNDILICTMAYNENEIYNNEDVKVLEKIIPAIKNEGYNIVIKPHPRDKQIETKYKALNCQIIDNKESIESILCMNKKIHAIISFSSTALITSNLFYNIKSISIIRLLNLDRFHGASKDEMLSFLDFVGNNIETPHNIKELLSAINNT